MRALPTTGMRGGLGRTLLTAFLALTIVPFALIGWYIVAQNRTSLQQEATNKLQLIATLKAENLESWLQARALLFRSALEVTEDAGLAGVSSDFWPAVQRKMPELQGALWSHDARQQVWGECALPEPQAAAPCESFTAAPERRAGAPVAIAFPQAAEMLVLCFDPAALRRGLQLDVALGQTGRVYLVHRDRVWLEDQTAAPATALPEGSCVALAGAAATSAWYANAAEVPVVGAYSPLAGADVGILVEQEQSEVLAPTELIETTVISGLLSVVLLTTVISALVIRQITRPVIRLTESALEMAAGNLDQHVPVASRDEIGILTYVFNQMAGELKSLYEDLEAKVVARTELLQKANYQIQRRAIQLEASLEVSQAVTSIRDPQALLERVADRIRDCFSYVSVAVYLVEPGGAEAHLHAISPVGVQWPEFVHAGDGTVIGRALRKGSSQLIHEPLAGEEPEWNRRITSYASTPLQMERRVLGVLAVRNAGYESLQEDDVKVLEHLANQVAIALENARAYERERLAAQQLEDNEAFKARFLANMSHELRGPLNSILGFSRLMLKGFDGPLTEEQAADLQRIHSNSQQLLDLINDILTISEIQAGLLDLRYQVVDLRELLLSVLPTASAMIR
ncbi:MAG TPA: histidine kinase dimerization/phospho-acceptor domain-containing protein, partial [Anaerolineae bacterium]|nr:histidine kinase dimerization/phospho-acceptor domain-containing protein [Anaerolineae bacterium]